MRNLRALLTATVSALCLLPTQAHAAPVTIVFGGTLTVVEPVQGVFQEGDSFTGSFTFDSDLPIPYTPLSALSFSIGAYSVALAPDAVSYIIIERRFSEGVDIFGFEVESGLVADSVGASRLDHFAFYAYYGLGALGETLPIVIPEEFIMGGVGLSFRGEDDVTRGVLGDLNSLEVIPSAAPVPEPATLTLVALGLLGVRWRRSRSRC